VNLPFFAWEQRKVIDFSKETFGGGTPKTSIKEYWNGEIPWIQSSDLHEHQVSGVSARRKVTEEGIQNSATKLVPKNSIAIVTRVGVGKIALMQFEYTTSQDFLSLGNLKVNEWFGVYSLYNQLQKELHNVQGTSIKGITKNELLDKEINIPTNLNEQNKIGEFFRKIDQTIDLYQDKKEKLEIFKKAHLDLIFSQIIRFRGYKEKWEHHKLVEVVDVRSGRDYKHLTEGIIPVYGTGGYMLSVNEALSYKEDAIGIGRKGTIDKPFILKAPFWTVDTLFYAVPRKKYDLDFTYYIFQRIDWKKKDESTGVPSLSKTTINNIDVLFPNYNEQKVIGRFFRELDNLITLYDKKMTKLKELKKAYLHKMFV
jgi:type I restriction enzyme, S subunit